MEQLGPARPGNIKDRLFNVKPCRWLLLITHSQMNKIIQSFLIFFSLFDSPHIRKVEDINSQSLPILHPGQQCLCIGLVGGWRLTPGRGVLGNGNQWRGQGEQTMMAPSFHWHVCVCWAWPTTWRTYGWKTMLTTIWINMPSDTSWGLSTTCVSLWGSVFSVHCYADDTQLYLPLMPSDPVTNLSRLIDCLPDINDV